MSYSNNYLPFPERAWSRVDNKCTYENSSSPQSITNESDNIHDPFVFYRAALINKGNVLQYKKNSSQLTKQQRYAQIAKGMWTNRTKTWATQSDIYTNPNTTSLKRVAYIEYPINDITPGSPANLAGPFVPVAFLKDPFNCPNFTFKDGGNLVCGVYQNPCTGAVIDKTFQPKFYPTSDSDVPGPIQELYWDPKIQTWYPKTRRTMNNSLNKWPTNYKLFRSAIYPSAPVLSLVSSTVNSVDLSWIIPITNCYPVTKFSIFVNNVLYKAIPYATSYTTTLTGLNKGPYQIYIVSIMSTNTSQPSNIITYNNEIVNNVASSNTTSNHTNNLTDLESKIKTIASENIGVSNAGKNVNEILTGVEVININLPAPAPA
jgi:hypothetical protein